jgi:hypothetical protein
MNPEHHIYHTEEEDNPDRQPQPAHDYPHRPEGEREPKLTDELTPAEQDEKEKAREEVRASLSSIFETLRQHPDKPNRHDADAAIDATPLRNLKPAYKLQLETVIVAEDPRRQDEQEFIARGLKVLSLWIHLQGLKRGTDRDLAALRANISA